MSETYNINNINGLPLNVCCDSTGQYVAYATTVSNNDSTGNPYYYQSTWYSMNYGGSFQEVNINIDLSYNNYTTSVSLSVISNSTGAYVIQSFTYTDNETNTPYTSLYYFEMTSSSSDVNPQIVNINLSTSSSSTIPASELENVLITSITNNSFVNNGQSFIFVYTVVKKNKNNQNIPVYQYICQFNPFAGNFGNNNYAYNNYYYYYDLLKDQYFGNSFVINTELTTTQGSICINSEGTTIYGICYTGSGSNLVNYETSIYTLSGITNSTQSNYNYLNFEFVYVTINGNVIPTISNNTDASNVPMYNICVNMNSLLLSNNINNDLNYTPSKIWIYGLSNLEEYQSSIKYNDASYGQINGIVTSSSSNNVVFSPVSNFSNSSSFIYCIDFSNNSTSSDFLTFPNNYGYNYWLSSCTSSNGGYYYLTSLSDQSNMTGSFYGFSLNFPYYDTTTGYSLYPDVSDNYTDTIDTSFNNFVMPIDPSTNEAFLYFNVLLVGCGGVGNYYDNDTNAGGGGGGAIQAINIPFNIAPGIYINNLSVQVSNAGGIGTQVVFNYSNKAGSITLNGGIGGNGQYESNTGGKGGTGSYSQTLLTSYWNGINNTCATSGGNGRGSESTGQNGVTTTNNGMTVTGSPGGSGTGGNASNSGNIKVPLYITTYKYESQGGVYSSKTISYPYNGGGGPTSNKYSNYGANGFVLLWLSS